MNRSLWRKSFFVAVVFFGGLSFTLPVSAASCSVSADTVIDSGYIETNGCDAITIMGSHVITWNGTIDSERAVAVAVAEGAHATFDGQLILSHPGSYLNVASSSTISHVQGDPRGVDIMVPTLNLDGVIDTDGRGCAGGLAGSAGSGPDTGTGVCGVGTSGAGLYPRGGASHGGSGGAGVSGDNAQTSLYDSSLAPSLLGAGGAGGTVGQLGGYGGGRVHLVITSTLTLNGSIRADASSATNAGGGSGGSIDIQAGTIAGSGTITANGGVTSLGAGGAGGRIGLRYNTNSGLSITGTSSSVQAVHGAGATGLATDGTDGSVYTLDRAMDDGGGNVYIRSAFSFEPGDYTRNSFTVATGTVLTCDDPGVIDLEAATLILNGVTWNCADDLTSFTVSTTSALWMSGSTLNFSGTINGESAFFGASGLNTTSSNVLLSGATWVRLQTYGTWQNSGMTLSAPSSIARTRFYVPGTLTLTNFTFYGQSDPGTAIISDQGALEFSSTDLILNNSHLFTSVSSTFNSLVIDAGSSIDASGRGCQGGFGMADAMAPALADNGRCGTAESGYGLTSYGGGAYGGAGGRGGSTNNPQTTTYGNATKPLLMGAGGAGSAVPGEVGGNGGGLIRLRVLGYFSLYGALHADGGMGTNAGGGSGGSIYVTAVQLDGTGSMTADGGDVLNANGGGGGGGRIMVGYTYLGTFPSVNITASGGTRGSGIGPTDGSDGTFFGQQQTNQAPNAPSGLGPVELTDGSTTSTANPSVTFTLDDPTADDNVRFQIQIATTSDFMIPVIDFTSGLSSEGPRTFVVNQPNEGDSFYTTGIGSSLASGSYYWRVRTIDDAGATSTYSSASGGSPAFVVERPSYTMGFDSITGSGLESVTATSIRVMLTTASPGDASVHYGFSGSATGGGVDYTGTSGIATIAAGETSTTISFTITNDGVHESTQTVIITLSEPSGDGVILGSSTYTYSILDDDPAVVSTSTVCGSGCAYTSIGDALDTADDQTVIAVGATYDASADTEIFPFTALPAGITIDCEHSGAVIDQVNPVGDNQIILPAGATIQNCTFGNVRLASSESGSDGIRILNNTFSQVVTSTIEFQDGPVNDFLIEGNTNINSLSIGEYIVNSGGVIQDNSFYFRGLQTAFRPFDVKSNSTDHLTIRNNIFENYTTGDTSSLLMYVRGSDISVTGNTIRYISTPFDGLQATLTLEVDGVNEFSSNIIEAPPVTSGGVALALRVNSSVPTYWTLSHNTVRIRQDCGDSGRGCVGISFADNNDPSSSMSVTANYNLLYRDGTPNGSEGFRIEKESNSSTFLLENEYNGFYQITSNLRDKNDNAGASLAGTTYTLNPFLRTQNSSTSDDYELAPFSPYLDIRGTQDIGAISGARRDTIHVDAEGVVDYSSVDATSTSELGDAVRSGDTMSLASGVYTPIRISSPLATTTIAIVGADSGVVIDGALSTRYDGIFIADATSSVITNLTIRNASSTGDNTYLLDMVSGVFDGQAYDEGVEGFVPARTTIVLSDSGGGDGGSGGYSADGFDVSSVVNADPGDWHLALLSGGGFHFSALIAMPNATREILASGLDDGGIAVDAFATSVFVYHSEDQTFTFNQAALDEAGITLPEWVHSTPALTMVAGPKISGIRLDGVHGVTITNVTSTQNGNGISFGAGSGENLVQQSVFSGSTAYDLNDESALSNTFEQVNFLRASSTFSDTGAVLVRERVRARTLSYVTGSPIQTATVTTTAADATVFPLGETDASGYTDYQVVPVYRLSASDHGTTAGGFNPYHFEASHAGYFVERLDASLDSQDNTVTISLLAPPAPNPPTGVVVSAVSTSTATLTWTDQSDNELLFLIEIRRPLESEAFPGTATTVANNITTKALTGLTPNTQYEIQVAAANGHATSTYALASTFTTAAVSSGESSGGGSGGSSGGSSGGGGGGGGGGGSFGIPIPTGPLVEIPTRVTTTAYSWLEVNVIPPPEVKEVWPLEDANVLTKGLGLPRDAAREARLRPLILADLAEFHLTASDLQVTRLVNFVAYGDSWATIRLGEGERHAVIRDCVQTMRGVNISAEDLDRVTRGQIPLYRNLGAEKEQLLEVRKAFRKIYGNDPDFKKADQNMAWNTLMYRIRFSRDLVAEKRGILNFKKTFKSAPKTPFEWAIVRVMGYIKPL